jgi:hypothetical protein
VKNFISGSILWIFLVLFFLISCLTGCVHEGVVNSYEAYLDTAGKEHQEFVEKGKYPDGSAMSEADKLARKLNYESSRKVIAKAREHNTKWNWLGGD